VPPHNLVNVTINPFTAEHNVIDLRQDRAYKGIRGLIAAMTNHYEETTAQHAQKLADHLSYFGTTDRETDIDEIVMIQSILYQWANNQPLAEAITALGSEGWRIALETANNVYFERREEK